MINLQFTNAKSMWECIEFLGKGFGDSETHIATFEHLTKFEIQQAEDLFDAYEILEFDDFEEETA